MWPGRSTCFATCPKLIIRQALAEAHASITKTTVIFWAGWTPPLREQIPSSDSTSFNPWPCSLARLQFKAVVIHCHCRPCIAIKPRWFQIMIPISLAPGQSGKCWDHWDHWSLEILPGNMYICSKAMWVDTGVVICQFQWWFLASPSKRAWRVIPWSTG